MPEYLVASAYVFPRFTVAKMSSIMRSDKTVEQLYLTASILVAIVSVMLWLDLYAASWHMWYIREDSWYFRLAPFSIYDFFIEVFTPQNTQGLYRPFHYLYWNIPKLFGYNEPHLIRIQSYLLHFFAAFSIFLLSKKLQKNVLVATTLSCLFLLHPIGTKTTYWLAAQHSIGNATFLGFSLFFFLQNQRKLFWLFFALAMSERMLSITWLPMFFLLDQMALKREVNKQSISLFARIKQSKDIVIVSFALLAFFSIPFFTSSNRLTQNYSLLKGLLESPLYFLNYITVYFYSLSGDAMMNSKNIPIWAYLLAVLLVSYLCWVAYKKRGNYFITPLIVFFSLLPFVVYTARGANAEYLNATSIGIFLGLGYLLLDLAKKLSPNKTLVFYLLFNLISLPSIYYYAKDSATYYAREYVRESQKNRELIEALLALDKKQPSLKSIYIKNPEYIVKTNNRSIPFLIPGLHAYIKNKFIFFNEDLDPSGLQNQNFHKAKIKSKVPALIISSEGKMEILND